MTDDDRNQIVERIDRALDERARAFRDLAEAQAVPEREAQSACRARAWYCMQHELAELHLQDERCNILARRVGETLWYMRSELPELATEFADIEARMGDVEHPSAMELRALASTACCRWWKS